MNYNTSVLKKTLLLNGAGENKRNPILQGLPFTVSARFNRKPHSISGFAGSSSPPTTAFSFAQDAIDPLLYKFSAVAGNSPFVVVDDKSFTRAVFTSALTSNQTVWEKELFIASLPVDAIQVWDVDQEAWVSVNFDTSPGQIPLVSQMCAIRFFPSWKDEFDIPRYGGAKFLSIYDFGTVEDDFLSQQVVRQINQDINRSHYIYLVKNQANTIEAHDINIKFKTNNNNSSSVVVRIKVNTLACYGFQIKDPVTI